MVDTGGAGIAHRFDPGLRHEKGEIWRQALDDCRADKPDAQVLCSQPECAKAPEAAGTSIRTDEVDDDQLRPGQINKIVR